MRGKQIELKSQQRLKNYTYMPNQYYIPDKRELKLYYWHVKISEINCYEKRARCKMYGPINLDTDEKIHMYTWI